MSVESGGLFFETYRKVDIDKEDGVNDELNIREKTLQKYKQFYGLFARWISLYQTKNILIPGFMKIMLKIFLYMDME